jgi:tight adherence protein B
MNMQTLAFAFLGATAVGGLAWVFIYPLLSGEKKAEARRASVARPEPVARQSDKAQRSRREQVEGTLKEVEARRQKDKRVSLGTRLTQAGLAWTPQKFMIISGMLGVVCFATAFLMGGGLLGAVGLAFAAGFGLPRWILGYLKKRREKNFLKALPDAVDVIVRGIKAGLPLFESIKVVAADAPEPLKSEFLAIIETQAIGLVKPARACSNGCRFRKPTSSESSSRSSRSPAATCPRPWAIFPRCCATAKRWPRRFKPCRWKPRHPRALSAHCRRS